LPLAAYFSPRREALVFAGWSAEAFTISGNALIAECGPAPIASSAIADA